MSRGVKLSFVSLPQELRGINCSFQNKREIVISERENAAFADLHTLFHEFREMLENIFAELGSATLTPEECLEAKAEHFAMVARMQTCTREIPAYFKIVGKIETPWQRYFGYALLVVLLAVYLFSCAFLPQFEDMLSEARRQRNVRM